MVNRNPNAYTIGHYLFNWHKKTGNVMEVTLNAARPAESKSGKIGVIIYEWKKNNWVAGQNVLWARPVSNKGFAPVKFRVKGDALKGNKFLMIFFKMRGTEAAAISDVTLKFL